MLGDDDFISIESCRALGTSLLVEGDNGRGTFEKRGISTTGIIGNVLLEELPPELEDRAPSTV